MIRIIKNLGWIFVAFYCLQTVSSEQSDLISKKNAMMVYLKSDTPPSFANAIEVELPHYWNGVGLYGSGWYEIPFEAEHLESEATWSVFIPQVIMNAQVWLNGNLLGSGGYLTKPISRNWHTPLMFSFSSSQLKKSNVLHIRVVSYTNHHAKLGEIMIGSELKIQSLYNTKFFKSVIVNLLSGTLSLLIGFLLLTIWLKRRESAYFWFTISCFMWTIYSVNIFVNNIPIPEEYWEKIVFLSSGWLPISIAFLMVRLAEENYPRIEKYLLIACALYNLIIWMTPQEKMFSLFPYWLQVSFLIGCLGISRLAIYWIRTKESKSGFILLMILGVVIAGGHDVLVQTGWLDLGDGLWLDYSLPLFFLIMSYFLVNRFLKALEEKEKLNIELEDRVKKAGIQLENNYQKILGMEKDQATTLERERIHRDLHDSIGAKLLSLVYRSEGTEQVEIARSALSDLRGIVQQAPMKKLSLIDNINEWELECDLRCEEAGKKLNFNSFVVGCTKELSSEKLLHASSILKEIVSNSIKHSASKEIDIELRYRLNCLRFDVKEQSDFSKVNSWKKGCGLDNMKFRINELKGKIRWKGDKNTGIVSWIFPVEN